MKHLFRLAIAAVLIFRGAPAEAAPELINGVAVIVDDSVITYEELERSLVEETRLLARQYERQPQVRDERISQLRRDRLDLLVERLLILHEFKRKGYVIPDSVFERALNEHIREQYGDRLRLARTLQAQGTTFEGFRQKHRESLIINLMVREFIPSEKILISPFKIEGFYAANKDKFRVEDQLRLRIMLIEKPPEGPGDGAKKLAEEIRTKISEGASFAEMAGVYSAPSMRAQGGDRGWVDRKTLREDLAKVAFALQPGKVSEVFERPEGYYLMLVEEARPAHTRSLAEVRDEVESQLKEEEYLRLRKRWVEGLKKKSFVRSF